MWQQKTIHSSRLVWNFIRRFRSDRIPYAASALTFTSLLALVPLMTVLLSILSGFAIFRNVTSEVQGFIFTNFVPAAGEVVQKYVTNFAIQTQKLSALGFLLLLATAVLMIFTIEGALNDIWGLQSRRRGVAAWLRYWAMLTIGPVLAGVSMATSAYIISIPWVAGAVKSLGMKGVLLEIVPILMQLVGLTFLYVVIPNCPVRWRYGFLGACVASLFFELARKLFLLYLTLFPTYQLVYGALASIPIFLLWLYLSWLIILCGALVSNIAATYRTDFRYGSLNGFMHAFIWLGALWKAQKRGGALSFDDLLSVYPGPYVIQPEVMIQELKASGLIIMTERNRFVLLRKMSSLSFSALCECLPWKCVLSNAVLKQTDLLLVKQYQAWIALSRKHLDLNVESIYENFFNKAEATGGGTN